MLKQCALAFAQSKPTEWDHFRQEWYATNVKPSVFVETVSTVSILDVATEVLKEKPLEEEMMEGLKAHKSQAMKREELE